MTCKIIPFNVEHIQQTFLWVQDLELRRLFLMRGEVTWEGHQNYFRKVLSNPSQKVYAIFADGRHVGNCGFKNMSTSKVEAEIWIYIGEPLERRHGVGRFATQLLIKEGFETLGLKSLYLHVADFNSAARKMYKNLGFIEVPLSGEAKDWQNRGCRIIRMELKKT
ncbi:MAG: GNAT family N-acetyltransferase [Nitrospirae bacterium]|nr:GNAT family N-acetyltransferase [Nitrospirota bacterium]